MMIMMIVVWCWILGKPLWMILLLVMLVVVMGWSLRTTVSSNPTVVLGQGSCSVFSQTTVRDLLSQHEHANGIVGTGHHCRRLVVAVLVMAGQGRCFGGSTSSISITSNGHSHGGSGCCAGSTVDALAGTLSFQGHAACR